MLPSLNSRFAQPGKATGLILPGNLFLGPVVEEHRLADLLDSKKIEPMVSSGRLFEDRCIWESAGFSSVPICSSIFGILAARKALFPQTILSKCFRFLKLLTTSIQAKPSPYNFLSLLTSAMA